MKFQLNCDDSIDKGFLEAVVDIRLENLKADSEAEQIAETCSKESDDDPCEKIYKIKKCVLDESIRKGLTLRKLNIVGCVP